ncbi:hypothetical protein FB567DRAFT_314842 [Paraphoma chrysanthemicola]|uniref:Uncharacterized protein n=1 Tax=Paraphoma chrysanthemicola TaxID=798071 RepID=A0A8K0RAC3_9PLEO|nr:hypothetical protein FB567DRAFT_314842 [Paraphoma chrysanthemicola]
MFPLFTPALLLLASAVKVHGQTPSVVTFISISPTPTTEEVFTIQTSVPGMSSTPCYEVCVMEPCYPCGQTLSEGSMGIPPGETPIPSSLLSIITDPLLSTTPLLTTPLPTTPLPTTPAASSRPSASSSANGTVSVPAPSRPGNAPPEQSTGASPSLQAHGAPFKIALAVSGLSLMGASLVFL